MKPIFNRIYQELQLLYETAIVREDHRFPLPYPHMTLLLVREAIDLAEADLPQGMRLRPDARLFLTINLHQMVVLPLLHRDAGPDLWPDEEDWFEALRARLIRDASVVVASAVEEWQLERQREREEEGQRRKREQGRDRSFEEPHERTERPGTRQEALSSSAILRASARQLSRLELQSLDVWG